MQKSKFVVVIVGLVGLTAFWIYWVSTSSPTGQAALVKFLSIEELQADTNHGRVKLGGYVEEGSIVINPDDLLEASFVLEQDNATIPVRYRGIRPDLFKDGAEVIVEGSLDGNVFVAENLQTKCASRYEGDLRNTRSAEKGEM
ncbi:MAG: cytochrome c maturation protein CcmE [Fidelibacterota bacterium]